MVEVVGRQVGNRDVVEQAAIAGLFNTSVFTNDEAATYLAKRLEAIASVLEKGWDAVLKILYTARRWLCKDVCVVLPNDM